MTLQPVRHSRSILSCKLLAPSLLTCVNMNSCYVHLDKEPIMQHHALLETYLRQLRLPTFAHNYAAFAQDAARTGLSCERYLLALSEAEIAHRDRKSTRLNSSHR